MLMITAIVPAIDVAMISVTKPNLFITPVFSTLFMNAQIPTCALMQQIDICFIVTENTKAILI